DLELCTKLLDSSDIDIIDFDGLVALDDTTAPQIIAISSNANVIDISLGLQKLSRPAAFLSNLASLPASTVKIAYPYGFGLPKSLWENFLRE
ncbi:hypothetical protein PMAYCL1PPCAC_08342, partial [Pristionchus mayeri]